MAACPVLFTVVPAGRRFSGFRSVGELSSITAGEATVSLAVNLYSASGRAFISWRGKLFWKANGSSGQQP